MNPAAFSIQVDDTGTSILSVYGRFSVDEGSISQLRVEDDKLVPIGSWEVRANPQDPNANAADIETYENLFLEASEEITYEFCELFDYQQNGINCSWQQGYY